MNGLEIHALGMSRSGNHAIADWIFAQAEAPKLLLNCAEGKTNPFHSCRPLASGLPWRAEPEIDMRAEAEGRFAPKALLLHSYEDSWLAHGFSRDFDRHHDAWVGPSRRRIDLLILRDPFNLFASRMKMGAALSPKIARKMWKQHAREALGRIRRRRNEPLTILYNRWASDRDYRRRIAHRLGLDFSDHGIDRVPDTLGGSSFDGTAFDGRAAEMPTHRRWHMLKDDPRYLALFDDEMIELSESLFGPPPAIFAPPAAPQRRSPSIRNQR